MPKPRRLTKEEKIQKRENSFKGTGLYIYENNTDGYLTLPKPASDGRKVIPPRGKFNGDSYFMQLVKPPSNLLRFMEEIKEEKKMTEQKLILDQPDTVTAKGTIEHVVDNNVPSQRINDSVDNTKKPDVLLNESPIDGLEIIKA
jgi:hypothetical protein